MIEPAAPAEGSFATLRTAFATTTRQIIAGLSAAAVTGVLAVVTPIGDKLRDMLWQEEVSVSAASITADEGTRAPLKIVLSDTSGSGISGGTVSIVSPDKSVIVHNGNFAFPHSDGSIDLTAPGLEVEPRAPGTSRLDVIVTTNRGTRTVGHVDVIGNAVHADLTGKTYSGTWLAKLNGVDGELTLIDTGNRLKGTLKLEDNTTYTVDSGYYDSRPFSLSLRDQAGRRMRINGIHCVVGPAKARWVVVNARVEPPARTTNTPPRYPQQCPPEQTEPVQRPVPFEEEMSRFEGQGIFFATASVR